MDINSSGILSDFFIKDIQLKDLMDSTEYILSFKIKKEPGVPVLFTAY